MAERCGGPGSRTVATDWGRVRDWKRLLRGFGAVLDWLGLWNTKSERAGRAERFLHEKRGELSHEENLAKSIHTRLEVERRTGLGGGTRGARPVANVVLSSSVTTNTATLYGGIEIGLSTY